MAKKAEGEKSKSERSGSKSGFTYEVKDGVAVLTFDLPGESVNTLSPESGQEFQELLTRAEGDDAAKAVVLVSGKKDNFIAGAKVDFLQTLQSAQEAEKVSREAQEGFERLENAKKPVVAAIHGSCLGGGLEWALACGYRIATDSPKTKLGLPEVQLGLIPGAGGTQRLPELIGLQPALDLVLTGKALKANKAKKLGVVDEVVPVPILEQVALRRARELADGTLVPVREHASAVAAPAPDKAKAKGKGFGGLLKSLSRKETWTELALEDNPLGRRVLFDQARKQVMKKTRGKFPAPLEALDVMRTGAEKGRKAGLEAEARAFGELALSDVSKRLVEIFFATTALKKDNGVADASVKPRKVEKVAILGGGLMGGGIAYVSAALQGVKVRLKDRDDAGVARGLKQVRSILDERTKRRSLTWRQRDELMSRVTSTTDYSGFQNVDMVIEAVFEDLDLKHRIFKELEAVVPEHCIIASNTSSLPIKKLAEGSKRPENVIGMHYFSPVHKMPLLEIIVHEGTADWVTATAVEVGKKQGKTVIVVNDGVGFYTSRILAPYLNEACYLLAEGAKVEDLDKALVELGFPVGPITLLDEVGIDVGGKVGKIMHDAFGARMAPPGTMEKVLADGREGRKNQRGFYRYENGKKEGVDETAYDLLPHGRDRKNLDLQEMAERVSLQMVNEAIHCLGEDILRSPRDGDIGAVFGLGFPPFLGGPFRYADQLGPQKLVERLEHWENKLGERFAAAPLLREKASKGGRFYE